MSLATKINLALPNTSKLDADLSSITTLRVGGSAAVLVDADSKEDLGTIARTISGSEFPVAVIGRGSNVLISDDGFMGAVIRLGKTFDHVTINDGLTTAGGATAFPKLANRARNHSLTGLEFAVAIPASVGGSVKMNAGAHGASVSEVFASADILDLRDGTDSTLSFEDLGFAYRSSSLTAYQVVLAATFQLEHGDADVIGERMVEYRRHRAVTQPSEAPNAGSMFTNPEGNSAGKLIEGCDLKGFRLREAEVSEKHANFFLAHDGALAIDVYELMVLVQREVLEQTGHLLIPEIRLLGEFPEGLRWE